MIEPVMRKKIPCREPAWSCSVCGGEATGSMPEVEGSDIEVVCWFCKGWELRERTRICVQQALTGWIMEIMKPEREAP